MEAEQILDLGETLAKLISSSSEYIENLPSDAREIVSDLQDIQELLNELQYMYKLECLEIEKKYHELRKPLFRRIQDLVSGKQNTFNKTSEDQAPKASIPNFWPTTLSHHPSFHHLIAEHDHQALNHLVNINIEYLTDASSTSGLGYRIHFEFSPNDFFEDRILTKTYLYGTVVGQSGDFVYHSANGTDIRWKNRIDFTKRPNGSRRASFFELFYPPTFATEEDMIQLDYDDIEDPAETLERIELDYCLGADLKDQILPSVVDWFTGKFLQEYSYIGEGTDFDEEPEVILRDPKGSRLLAWALEQEAMAENGPDGPTMDDINGFSPLYLAARLGHVGAVKLLLKWEHADIGWRDSEGRTSLYIAAREGRDAVVKVLVAIDGVDLNAQMINGWTPLSTAANRGYDACVKVLVAHKGVDVNLQDSDGMTALYAAAMNGHYDAVNVLLSHHSIKLNVQLPDGATPLHIASDKGHTDIVKALVAQTGTNVNLQDNEGFTPLHVAVRNGHYDAVRVLLCHHGIKPNAQLPNGITPLYIASNTGHTNIITALVAQAIINVNLQTNGGLTPLHVAASSGHYDAVKALLSHHSTEVNVQIPGGATPLYIASQKGHTDIVKALVARAGTNVNLRRNGGPTPLAASNDHEASVRALLGDAGTNVNLGMDDGWTPLHIAVRNGREGVVKALLGGHPHINVNARTKQGHTPLAIAAKERREAIITLLRNSGGV